MVLKWINAIEAKTGTNILIDDEPYTVKSIDISKTGKHGASKVRIEAIGIISDQKKVLVKPGHDKFGVPMIEKRRAQILSMGDKVGVMDLESFETLDVPCSESIKNEIKAGDNVEYWNIEGKKIVKRKI